MRKIIDGSAMVEKIIITVINLKCYEMRDLRVWCEKRNNRKRCDQKWTRERVIRERVIEML